MNGTMPMKDGPFKDGLLKQNSEREIPEEISERIR